MPKGPREIIQSRLRSSLNEVDKIMSYLIECGELNREHHPEITQQYEVAYAFFAQAKELLQGFLVTY